jgi:aminoglycoside 6'-N-acetyltransferase
VDVTLRPLTRDDLPLLGAWLRDPVVETWWHDDPAREALERQYGAGIDGHEPTVLRIAVVDGAEAGFVQWYRFADEPAYATELAPHVAVPQDAWSLDYLVAAEHRGRGVGTAVVAAALAAIGDAPVVVPVHAENAASIGVLRAAGFVLAGTADLEPDNPAHSRAHVVLTRGVPG